jgi:hypothetical protein
VGDYDAQWSIGNKLSTLTATVVNGVTLYSGIWRPNPAGQALRIGRPLQQFLDEHASMWKQGFRLSQLAITAVDGVAYYHSVFDPSTSNQGVSAPLSEVDFQTQDATNRKAGMSLRHIVSNVQSLNLTDMANRVSNVFTPATAGFALTIGTTAGANGAFTRETRTGGFRRTATDAPARASTTTARMTLASVTKTVTAAVVQHALDENGPATLDSKIVNFLPSNWAKGANVNTISIRDLLTHQSGFRPLAGEDESYQGLKALVARPIAIVDKTSCIRSASPPRALPGGCYANHNFALFRIIVPHLTGYSSTGKADATVDSDTQTRFLNYLDTNILSTAGVPAVATAPSGNEPTLYYPFPAGNVRGQQFGDLRSRVGGYGIWLSSDELGNFLARRYSTAVLGGALAVEQDENLLGWEFQELVLHANARTHGGMHPNNLGAEVKTLAMSICQRRNGPTSTCINGVHVALLMNSAINTGPTPPAIPLFRERIPVQEAYNASWFMTY